jgi:hypothetical protein
MAFNWDNKVPVDIEPLAGFGLAFIVIGVFGLIFGKDLTNVPSLTVFSAFAFWVVLSPKRKASAQHDDNDDERPSFRIL